MKNKKYRGLGTVAGPIFENGSAQLPFFFGGLGTVVVFDVGLGTVVRKNTGSGYSCRFFSEVWAQLPRGTVVGF